MKNLISPISNSSTFSEADTKQLEWEMKNGSFNIQEPFGNGKVGMLELEPWLHILKIEARFFSYQQIVVKLVNEGAFILAFKEAWMSDAVINGSNSVEEKMNVTHRVSGITLESSLQNLELKFKKGATIRSLYIMVHPNWIDTQLHNDELTVLVNRLLQNKEAHVYNSIDVVYREMLNELFNCKQEQPLRNQFIKNRVLLLLEKFFTRQHERFHQRWAVNTKSTEELQRLIRVETVLIQSLHETAPTIDQLAKLAAMSATKLKSLFKDVYGMPVYVYYLHHRMQVAKKLLLTQEFSVRDVGQQMGYQNISHFAAAFKKVHGILPGSLLGFK